MFHAVYLKENDDLMEILESRVVEMMEKQEDLFSSSVHPVLSAPVHSHTSPESGAWKGYVDRYLLENEQLKEEIRKLKRKRSSEEGPSADLTP